MRLTEKRLRAMVREAMALPDNDYRVKARRLAEEIVDGATPAMLESLRNSVLEHPTEHWEEVLPHVFGDALDRAFSELAIQMHAEFWKLTKGGTPKRHRR
jgi:hypothetical protein